MSEKLEAMRTKLTSQLNGGIDKLEAVQSNLTEKTDAVEGSIKAKLDEAKACRAAAKQKMSDAVQNLKNLAEEKKLEGEAEVAGWKAARDLKKLEKRADRAESAAEMSIIIALASIEDASEAIFEAVAARLDFDGAL